MGAPEPGRGSRDEGASAPAAASPGGQAAPHAGHVDRKSRDSARVPAGDRGRVAAVHAQARATLRFALAFMLAAPISAVVPHDTGAWLPLHLFLVGGVLSAISGATQLLAVTWSSAPAPRPGLASLQRWLLAIGAAGLALARELDAGSVATAVAGAAVITGLAVLAGLLLRIRSGAVVDRFTPAIDGYVLAIVLGILGSAGGIVLATGRVHRDHGEVRSVHVIVNLLGLVGLVIAATLPFFVATQVRARMSPRATPVAVRSVVLAMATAVVAAAGATLLDVRVGTTVALGGYALGVVALFAFVPPVGRRQLTWAGPRVVQLCSGVLWWAAATGMLAASLGGGDGVPDGAVLALVVGGYAQIVVASLAYFGPVLRGGGHVALTAGFGITRSWLSVVVGNLAAVAALLGWHVMLGALFGIWMLDLGFRAVLLHRGLDSTEDPAS